MPIQALTTTIILFRCHTNPALCAQRLRLVSSLNPSASLWVIYGGAEEHAHEFHAATYGLIDGFYVSEKPPLWNWQHGDLVIREWFSHFGKNIAFCRAHVIEWDLLLCASLDKLYSHVPVNGVALTALRKTSEVVGNFGWLDDEPYQREWNLLLRFVEDTYGYSGSPFVSLGPGVSYSRQFLAAYAEQDIPLLSADELRVPLFAQCLGFPVCDTMFLQAWDAPLELQYFNCRNREVSPDAIERELNRSDGRRVFHPYRQLLSEDQFARWGVH